MTFWNPDAARARAAETPAPFLPVDLGDRLALNAWDAFQHTGMDVLLDRAMGAGPDPAALDRADQRARDLDAAGDREKAAAVRDWVAARRREAERLAPARAAAAQRDADRARAFAEMPGFETALEGGVALLGQLAGSLPTPESLVGPTGAVGAGLRGVSRFALKSALANAAVTAAVDPVVQLHRIDLGEQDGFDADQTLASIGLSGALGAAIPLSIGAVQSALARLGARPAEAAAAVEAVARQEQLDLALSEGLPAVGLTDAAAPSPGSVAPAAEGVPPHHAPSAALLHRHDAQAEARAALERPDRASGAEVVYSPSGQAVQVVHEVVEADDLVTSNLDDGRANPAFPAALQPRARDRAASQAQIRDIAAHLEPARLGRAPELSSGAPLIGGDRVVESGNGRVLAIRQAYAADAQGAGARYRAWLEDQGFEVAGMARPVLVRRRLTALTAEARAALALDANASPALALGAVERARAEGRGLTGETLSLWRGGAVTDAANRDFVRAWAAGLPATERAALVDARGRLAPEGARRLDAALMARAYGAPDLLATLLEDADPNIKAIATALKGLAPDWARIRAGVAAGRLDPGSDATDALLSAIGLVREARRARVPVADRAAQVDAFDPPPAGRDTALRALFKDDGLTKPASAKAIQDRLGAFLAEAEKNTAGPRLFGEDALTTQDMLAAVLGREAGLFDRRPTPPGAAELAKLKALVEDAGADMAAARAELVDALGDLPDDHLVTVEAAGTLDGTPDGAPVSEKRTLRDLVAELDDEAKAADAVLACARGSMETV